MPYKSKRPCGKAGCKELSNTRYCSAHSSESHQSYDRWRGTSASRGYDADWQRIRVLALERDRYMCVHCLRDENRPVPATVVDHIVTIKAAPHLRLNLSNLQCLCTACHNIKTNTQDGGFGRHRRQPT